MKPYPAAFHVLRVGIAITFLWIGLLILKSPEAWGGYLQPWAMELLPLPIEQLMIGTAIFDLVVGFLLLVDVSKPPRRSGKDVSSRPRRFNS